MICPACGHDNPADYAFCGGCGGSRTVLTLSTDGGRPADEPVAAVPPQPVGHDGPRAVSDATRYLCSAVYFDAAFANRVVRDVVDRERRAVATSPGVDVALVARHALAARRRHLVRDVVLTAVAAFLLFELLRLALLLVVVAAIAAWLVVLVEALFTRYGVVAHALSRTAFRADRAPEPIDPRRRRRLHQIPAYQDTNVIVHSGFSPFVGSGIPVGGWSFAIDITKPPELGDVPKPFTVGELRDHVSRALAELRWPALSIHRKVIVSGSDIRHDRRFLPDVMQPPVAWLDAATFEGLLSANEDRVRPYLHVEAAGWRGELVASMFLRFMLLPSSLFVEGSYSVLAPVRDEYHEVDRLLPSPTAGQVMRLAATSGRNTLGLLLAAPGHVLSATVEPLRRAWWSSTERRQIEADLSFDYGASVSVRELASDQRFQRYFQRLDREMYLKVVEGRVLDSIVEFLDHHSIDTGEIRQRSTTILNNGVFVSGSGQVQAGNLAAGEGASAGTGRIGGRLTAITRAASREGSAG